MSNRNLWIMIGVLALGIFAIVIMEMVQTSQKPITNSMSDGIDRAGDSITEFK